jgi:hypothetical protein
MPTTGKFGSSSPKQFSIPPGQERASGAWLSHEGPEASVMMQIPGIGAGSTRHSSDHLLSRVLGQEWPHEEVLKALP